MQRHTVRLVVWAIFTAFAASACSESPRHTGDSGARDTGARSDIQDVVADVAVGDVAVADTSLAETMISGSLSVRGSVTPVGASTEELELDQDFSSDLSDSAQCGRVYHNIGASPALSPIHNGPNGQYASLAFVVCTDGGTAIVSIAFPFANGQPTMRGSVSEGSQLLVTLRDETVDNPFTGRDHSANYAVEIGSVFATITDADPDNYSAHLSIPLITLSRQLNPSIYACEATPTPENCPTNGDTLTIAGELQIDHLPEPM